MPDPVIAEINLDADLVTLTSQGNSVQVYACDFVDGVNEAVDAADKSEPLPDYSDDETGETRKGTHGRGQVFVDIVKAELAKAGLNVRSSRAVAIWDSLVQRVKEYRELFRTGRSSPPSSDSPLPPSSADVALSAALLLQAASKLQPDASMSSMTESSTPKAANET